MNAARLYPLVALAFVLAATPASTAPLVIENAWIRMPAAGQSIAAGYCDIRNDGRAPITIVGFSGPVRVAMHETRVEAGVARMRPVREITVPAQSKTRLAPGGKHLMLFGINAKQPAAQPVTLHARLASGEEISATFEVRPVVALPGAGEGRLSAPQREVKR